ncbi:RING finger protein [Nosema bombycis CQ1]|uniref:RING finger protein n=1 Tax=Nosema bombycis (strain CQ1 / CVCC 102059) TaxID=578461 RepID=R0KTL4_NOSB1|nr:RING finger protein [Nosema bombycis CQ1]|eukprot:EOB13572.1 RING finger protein [Nosema bombycis CQ1]
MFPKSVIVLKKKEIGVLPDNIHHLKIKYSGDCPICLQFHTNPVTSYCEHVYCRDCIYESLDFTLECPICKKEISRLFDVHLNLKEDVGEFLCFKLLSDLEMTLRPESEYLKYPYQKIYFLEEESNKPQKKSFKSSLYEIKSTPTYFYQSVDGQPYFLDNEILSRIIRREGIKNLPRLLYGKIESVKESLVGKKKNLKHLHEETVIYIVKIIIL